MEQIISGLLRDFEAGKLTRRKLIQALVIGVTAGPAAFVGPRRSRRNNRPSRRRAPRRRGKRCGSITSPTLSLTTGEAPPSIAT